MNSFGFYIKKLHIEGNNVQTVTVNFFKGLNVIYGPSDTGKTFIFECIDYMLGAGNIPKDIPEAKKYSLCKLEIETFRDEFFLLERSLKGGDFKLYDKNHTLLKELKEKNTSKGQESISDFLLKICNIENKKIRKLANGEKQNLYFQDISRYFLIDEEIVITKASPISAKPDRGYNPLETFEKNVFKFLITGQDDGEIITLLKKDEITNKKGKIELYDELIKQLNEDLKDVDYGEIDKQIEKLNEGIKNFRENYSLSNLELKKYDEEKDRLNKNILSQETHLINLNEILIRSSILKKQYVSDIARLKATIEIGQELDTITTYNCPVCDNEINEKIDIQELIDATRIEIKKISLLLIELENSQKVFLDEVTELKLEITKNKMNYEEVLQEIQDELSVTLENISINIQEFTNKKEELSKIKTLKEKLDNYTVQKEAIETIINSNKLSNKNTNYEDLTTVLIDPVIIQIKNILIGMDFENIQNLNVSFSETLLDFTIGEKNRKEYGKGYRAILYAVFAISLLEYFRNKPYQIGFALIDSPLNPYKAGEQKDDGVVPHNLGEKFYRYLAKNIKHEQVILIENTPIPDDLKESVNYIVFDTENGFLPKSQIL